MRLLFLILALLVGSRGWAQVGGVTFGAGFAVTSFANAQATATATPNEVLVQAGPTTEAGTIQAVNTSITVETLNNSLWYLNTTGSNLNITSSLTKPCTLMGLNFLHDTASGNIVSWNSLGVGSNVAAIGCSFYSNQTAAAFASTNIFTTSNQLFIDRCSFYRPSGSGNVINLSGLDITAGTVLIQNSRIINVNGNGVSFGGVSANIAYKIYNCDFVNSTTGLVSSGAMDAENNIFTGNTTAINLSTSASTTQFKYCAFTNSIGSLGTGSITITAARTYSDPNNYWISPGSQTLNAGVSINGLTGTDTGLNGVLQGAGGIIGMGCNPYSLALCGGYGVGK